MTTLTVLNCARTGAALSLTGATAAATGDRWLNTGNEVLVVTNTDASAHTVGVTVAAAPDGKDVTEAAPAPMEAKLVETLPTEAGWQFEPKWDGFRTVVFKDGEEIELGSRNEKPLTRYFPEVVEAAYRAMIAAFITHELDIHAEAR